MIEKKHPHRERNVWWGTTALGGALGAAGIAGLTIAGATGALTSAAGTVAATGATAAGASGAAAGAAATAGVATILGPILFGCVAFGGALFLGNIAKKFTKKSLYDTGNKVPDTARKVATLMLGVCTALGGALLIALVPGVGLPIGVALIAGGAGCLVQQGAEYATTDHKYEEEVAKAGGERNLEGQGREMQKVSQQGHGTVDSQSAADLAAKTKNGGRQGSFANRLSTNPPGYSEKPKPGETTVNGGRST